MFMLVKLINSRVKIQNQNSELCDPEGRFSLQLLNSRLNTFSFRLGANVGMLTC